MAWSNVHPKAPTDEQGRPIHPEKGYPICGYKKTDATDKAGKKRHDIPYCLQSGGWGTDRDTGHCSKHNGHGPGAKEGWENQNARHLLYSNRMNEDDREIFEAVVQHPEDDDKLLRLEDAADMLRNMIGWEQTRLVRAVNEAPDVERVDGYRCPECGNSYKSSKSSPPPDECTGSIQVSQGVYEPCPATVDDFESTGESFVDMGDKALERKESHIANLIMALKKTSKGADIHVDADHTHKGDPDEPVEVSINHVGVDLPDDVDEPDAVVDDEARGESENESKADNGDDNDGGGGE